MLNVLKRILMIILTVFLLFSGVPIASLATETESDTSVIAETTITVSLSALTQQAALIDMQVMNLPTEGYYTLGDTVEFTLHKTSEDVLINRVSASLNGADIGIQESDDIYSIPLPAKDEYEGDTDGRLEIYVDAEIPSVEAVTHIICNIPEDDSASIMISPEKESYHANETVTLYIDLADGYILEDANAMFGDDALDLTPMASNEHDASYLLEIPDFDMDTVKDIVITITTKSTFTGYTLTSETTNATVSFDSGPVRPGEKVTATITASDDCIILKEKIDIIAKDGNTNLQEVEYDILTASDDLKSQTIAFTVPDLGMDPDITFLLNAEGVKRFFIRRVIAESDDASKDIINSVTVSPSILYEGATVTLSGLPDGFEENMVYPYGSSEPYTQLVKAEHNYVFTMPGYDVEIICEEQDLPLIMNPEDVYTPNTDFTYDNKSEIPNEPSMEVKKSAAWTNIQSGEALVTIGEYDLNQYTNVPCDYIIMVDCSATMSTVDAGTSKSRYALANEAIIKLLDKIQTDNNSLSDDQKSRVAFMTYSGSGDNGRHPTSAQYESGYYAATDALSTGDYDYFLSGVYEYSGFTTDLNSIKTQLNSNIRRGSKINMALDKVIQLLQAKGNSIRKTKVINLSDCGNHWYGPMREGYFSGKLITDWLGVHNDQGVTAHDKVEAIKNTYGAYFMQICVGPTDDQRNITRTSISEASGDHLFWTYDGTETRFMEIFTQVHDIPYEISATKKQIVDIFDTTYWDIIGIESCSTGMDTVSLNGNKLTWNIPDGTAEQAQTCSIKVKLKDQYRYLATSDTSYRTNADGTTPGLTYSYTIKNGIYDSAIRSGGVTTPTLKYGTLEFNGTKTWTVSGSNTSSIVTTLYQTLPGYSESAIETITLSDPNWSYAYTNAARKTSGKYPYVKYNNTGQTVNYRIAETVPPGYTQLPLSTRSGTDTTVNFYNEPYKIKASITKTDSETGNRLSGAVFEVYQWSTQAGKYIAYKGNTSGTVNGTSYEAGNVNGRASIMQMDETSKGVYTTPSWLYYTPDNNGKFAVVEAKAPSGYYGDWANDSLVTDASTDEDKVFHNFSIDASGSNNKQTLILSSSYGNERVLGQISFSKKDKESGVAIPQGDASLENAAYRMYAASDIIHADGITGTLYTKGDVIRLNLISQSEKENIYTFAPRGSGTTDTLIVPAGGKVTVTGMELGNYSIQETKASEGYLLNTSPYTFSLAYQNEKVKIVKSDLTNGAYEQVKKQSLSFYKVTYDDPDTIFPLEGAKFSVYLVSSLNGGKYTSYTDDQVEQAIIDDYRDRETLLYDPIKNATPAVVYDEADSADVANARLVKSVTYSTGETHRISKANGYLVAELVSDANGIVSLPAMPYGRYVVVETTTPENKISTRPFVFSVTADEIHGSTDSSTDTGGTKLESKALLVDRPVSSLIRIEKVDARSNQVVLKPGAGYVIHDLHGVWFDTYMEGKTTAEKEAYKEKYGDLVVQYTQGSYLGSKDEPFVTKRNTAADLPLKSTYIDTVTPLPPGIYELEEINAPDGYVLQGHEGVIRKSRILSPNYTFYETEETGSWTSMAKPNTRFTISSEYAVYDSHIGEFVTTIRQGNDQAIGKISVYAEGEMLENAMPGNGTMVSRLADKIDDFLHTVKDTFGLGTETADDLTEAELSEYKNYVFTYTTCPIEGAEFIIYAAEDIYSQEYDAQAIAMLEKAGTPVSPLFASGDVVTTLTTDKNGQAWTGTDDWPGTDEAKGLPIGKYQIVQTKAGEGFALTEENMIPRDVTIAYAGQTVPVIYKNETYQTPRQQVRIDVDKTDQDTGTHLSGAVFGLYTAEDIINRSEKSVVRSDTLIAIAETTLDSTGNVANAVFDSDLPLAKYYIKELCAPYGYVSSSKVIDIDASYQLSNQKIPVLEFETEYKNVMTQVQINLMDYDTDVALDGAQLQVLDPEGNSFTTILTKHNDNLIIRGLCPEKNYTLKVLTAREGYHYAPYLKNDYVPDKSNSQECKKQPLIASSDSISFTVEDTEKLQTVSIFHKPLTGHLTIQKTGQVPVRFLSPETGFEYQDTGLPGAEYTLKAAEDIVHPDGYTGVLYQKGNIIYGQLENPERTDANGIISISGLPLGVYEVTELKAPEGYYRSSADSTRIVHLAVPDHISERPEEPVTQILHYTNERQQPGIPSPDTPDAGLTAVKYGIDGDNRSEVEGAEFTLYAKEDIKNIFGTVIAPAGTMIDQAISGTDGIARFSSNIPIGVYEVKETKAPDGYYRSDKTLIFHLDKWKNDDTRLFLNDTGYIENPVIDVRVKLVDDLTGNELADASLQVIDETGHVMDAWITKTDDGHRIKGLIPGQTYRIREILPRDGYLLHISDAKITTGEGKLTDISDTEITFTLPDVVAQPNADGSLNTDMIPPQMEIVIANPFVVGDLTINKSGDTLSSWNIMDKLTSYLQSIFSYSQTQLEGAEFSVYAAEDIIHPDGVTGVIYHAGDLVDTNVRSTKSIAVQVTDSSGIAAFRGMYPGNYLIKETRTPEGFVTGENWYVTLPYQDGYTSPVQAQEGNINWINKRQPVRVEITKRDIDEPEQLLEGALFGLYNQNDILNASGDVIVVKDTLLEMSPSDSNGIATFVSALPHGMYYVKEMDAPAGYTSSSEIVEIDASYNPDVKEIYIQKDFYNKAKKSSSHKPDDMTPALINDVAPASTGDTTGLFIYGCLLVIAITGIFISRKKT